MPPGEIPPGSLGWLRWGFVCAHGVLIVRAVSEWSSSTPVIVGGIALGIGLNGILLFLFGVVLSTFVRNVKRIL
jgi:hypothetical protein